MMVQYVPQPSLAVIESQLALGVLVQPFYFVALVSRFGRALGVCILAKIGEVPLAVAFLSRKKTFMDQPAQGPGSFLVGQIRPGKGGLLGHRPVAALAPCYRMPCIGRQTCLYIAGFTPRSELVRVALVPRSAPLLPRRRRVLCCCLHFFGQPSPEVAWASSNIILVTGLEVLEEWLTTSVA